MLRTVQLVGSAYSLDGSLSATVTIDGQVVYDGALDNVSKKGLPEIGADPDVVLATWQQDFGLVYPMDDVDTRKKFSLEITGGDSFSGVIFIGLKTDNCMGFVDDVAKEYITQPEGQFDFPSKITNREDGKFNVAIDGQDVMWTRSNEFFGPWNWRVFSGSTLTCDYEFLKIVTPDSSYTRVYDPVGGSYFDPPTQTSQILKKYSYSPDAHLICESLERCVLAGTTPGSGAVCFNGGTCQQKEWADTDQP